ncbi:SDR family oxidoreductase [Brachybacterium sp. FME24]|uniref:SDR family oxidoreductase n=1 Tax=Brachybacterium sp. FME24 TaxID=2742605 RepID=UPI001865EFD6|nr:SDR family oxidoreductase [Brachybacterium sp. FME24]
MTTTAIARQATSQTAPKIILITGASSGIGAATARQLAADGHVVVLGARRRDRLDQLAAEIRENGGVAYPITLDITDLERTRGVVQHIIDEFGRLDVLINNAGVMPLSTLEQARVQDWNRMIDVNIRGVLHGIAAAQPVMREQKGGHIITLASTGAHEVLPSAAVYCGTKYAVRAITEGLRLESEPWMRVTTICPGVTESELADTITDPEAAAAMREYRAGALPASAIAQAICYAVSAEEGVDVNEIIVRPVTQRP